MANESTKFDIDGTGTFKNLQIRIHVVYGGDVVKPRFLFDAKMKEGHSLSIKDILRFLDNVMNFRFPLYV